MTWFSRNIGDPVVALLTGIGKIVVGIFADLLHETEVTLLQYKPEIQQMILSIIKDCVFALIKQDNMSWNEKLATAVNTAKANLQTQGVTIGTHLLVTLAIAEVSKLHLADMAANPLAVPPVDTEVPPAA